jgi:hypothetical protein
VATISELTSQSVLDSCMEIEVVPAEVPDPSYKEPEDWDQEEDGEQPKPNQPTN